MTKTISLISCFCVLCLMSWSQDLGGLFGSLGKAGKALESADKISKAVQKTAEDITPEQEYYIGRSVSANILQKYPAWDNEAATLYLNVLVKILAQHSTRPETFGGYHVLILDSDQINAFGAPGGFIFVTRGMLRFCPSETAVAAVLAHEIAHIEHEHGLKAIKGDRLTSAFAVIGTEIATNMGNEDVQKLTAAFGGSITDITKTLINNGYSKDLEAQADQAAVDTLKGSGYNPVGLLEMLRQMKAALRPGSPDFAKTHPSPDERMRTVTKKIGTPPSTQEEPALATRFQAALGGI